MNKKSETLKSCPFCGGEAEITTGSVFMWEHIVVCKDCGASSKTIGDVTPSQAKIKAIKAWNTRKPMERILERLEEEIKKCNRNYRECMRNFYVEGMSDALSTKYGMNKAIEIIKEEGGV